MIDREVLQQKVLEIINKYPRPHTLTEQQLKVRLEVPYSRGITWYRDPDPVITEELRKNFGLL